MPISPTDGWVSCDTNTLGIEGAFYTYDDGAGSTITPANFDGAGTEICVTGEVGQVVDGDYSVWGAGLGFNFANEASWDASAAGISGVSFNITEIPAGTATRVIFVDSADTGYCAEITAPGAQSFSFTDTAVDCWDTAAAGAMPAPTDIKAVQWQVATNADASYPFSFCISDLMVTP